MTSSHVFIDFEFFAGIVNRKDNVNSYRKYEDDEKWL